MKRRAFFASTLAAAFGSASALAQTASNQFKFPENVDENAVNPPPGQVPYRSNIPVFDFRIRPPYKGYMNLGIIKAWRNIPTDPRKMRPTGFERRHVESIAKADMNLLVKEMEEANVIGGVLMGRQTMNPVYGGVPNEDLAELCEKYPGKFVAFAGICPHDPKALEKMEYAIKTLGMKGVSLDPGWCDPAIQAYDKKIYPIVDLASQLNVPVAYAMSAYTGPDLTYTDPSKMMPMLKQYKNVNFILCHGAWPHVQEVLGLAAVCPNLYLVPDAYFYVRSMPFADEFVKAANSFMKYRMLFGTGYPIRGFEQCVENWSNRGLTNESLRLSLFENAKYLLNL